MTQYREILRLTAMGLPQRAILKSVQCSQKTVVKVQHRDRELKNSWPLDDSMTDAALEEKLFPKTPKVSPTRRCRISTTSIGNFCGTASTRSYFGRSIWRLVAKVVAIL